MSVRSLRACCADRVVRFFPWTGVARTLKAVLDYHGRAQKRQGSDLPGTSTVALSFRTPKLHFGAAGDVPTSSSEKTDF